MNYKEVFFVYAILLFSFKILNAQQKDCDPMEKMIDPRDNQRYSVTKIDTFLIMRDNLNYKTQKGCWYYNNDSTNYSEHGRLYSLNQAKSACPLGWYLPSLKEIKIINSAYYKDCPNSSSHNPGFLFTDNYGGGGYRTEKGKFYEVNKSNHLWTSTKDDYPVPGDYYYFAPEKYELQGEYWNYFYSGLPPSWALSVRCIKKIPDSRENK